MKRSIGLVTVFMLSLMACNQKTDDTKNDSDEKKEIVQPTAEHSIHVPAITMEKNGLTLSTAPSKLEYPTAELKLKSPENSIKQAGPVVFNFEVLDYNLQEQTNEEKSKVLANSAKGQHIHFILNNAPYQAKYEPNFEANLLEGNNVIVAFLSKSFHESVKTSTAFFFENFYIGEGESFFDKTAPHLFYSRPKGSYKKSKAEKILVDFYLMNTSLTEEGNQVKLTVDTTEFSLPHWAAYFIEGLTVGKHDFRIQLVNAAGELIDGPFNDSGVRTIEIVED